MIDCGEGTQLQLLRFQVRHGRINHIFISHLHGDHYLGLMGLIFTFHLQGRTEDLHIYGPRGLDEIITIQLRYSESTLLYNVHFHQLTADNELIFENEDICIRTIALNHRLPCFGFIFEEKQRKYKLMRDILPKSLTRENLQDLKDGKDIVDGEGKHWSNPQLATPPQEPRKYAYCSDTRFLNATIPQLAGANLMYHEATFLSEMQERAESTYHSTAAEAGIFATQNCVKQLIIGHYSSRYFDLNPFLEETKQHFSDTLLAIEGQTYEVPHRHLTAASETPATYSASR